MIRVCTAKEEKRCARSYVMVNSTLPLIPGALQRRRLLLLELLLLLR